MNNAPASRAARPMDPLPQPSAGRVIAVASGKGGVGKTWLSITLGHMLATREARVLLVDGDFGLANIDIQLGLTPSRDLSHVAAGQCSVAEAITCYAGADGQGPSFGILPGRSGASVLSGLTIPALDALLTELRALSAYDTLLLDLGAGIDRITRRLAAWADTLLVVTTDEPTALADACAAATTPTTTASNPPPSAKSPSRWRRTAHHAAPHLRPCPGLQRSRAHRREPGWQHR